MSDANVVFTQPKKILGDAPVPLLRHRVQGSRIGAMYSIPKHDKYDLIKSTLTLQPRTFGPFQTAQPYPIYEEDETHLHVPRIFGMLQFGEATIDARTPLAGVEPRPDRAIFATTLVPKQWQADVVDHMVTCLQQPPLHCGMLSAACGLGKTCMAIAVICRLGVRAAVLVHKEFLLTQWTERFAQFCPDLDVGRVQGDKCQIGTVTIVMIQTAAITGKFAAEDFGQVEFVVVDECHHLCASTFQRGMRIFNARYVMGLTATIARSDGNEEAIFWLLGHPVVTCTRIENAEDSNLTVQLVKTPRSCVFPEIKAGKSVVYSKMLTKLMAKQERTDIIVGKVAELSVDGRDILVISERIDLLDKIKQGLAARGISSAKYVGETSKKARERRDKEAAEAKILLTSRAMASEGFDRASISTVVLATPLKQGGGLEQSIGRCQRSFSTKSHANIVVDIVDDFSLFGMMARGRERFYKEKKYTIVKEGYDSAEPLAATTTANSGEAQPPAQKKLKFNFVGLDVAT